jgi:hypothetical protein
MTRVLSHKATPLTSRTPGYDIIATVGNLLQPQAKTVTALQ